MSVMAPQQANKCVLVLLLPLLWMLCALGAGHGAGHASSVMECADRCPLQNKTDDGLLDAAGCDGDCRIEQCGIGCRSWQRALQTSCQTVCNGTQELLPPKELYCVMGCNDAVNLYFQRLKEEIGVPPAPALVADSLTSHSLSLEWDGLEHLDGIANLSYLVQWRYEELAAAWQYCRNQSWGPHSTAHVDNLQPYSKYRFRVALLLPGGHNGGELVVSAPSVVISTLASGVPTSPPTITRATAVDWGRVSVSWLPGRFPNGPVLSYVLHISELPAGYSALKDIPASESLDFYMFQNLLPGRNYNVSVAMRNGVGEGPAATAVVSTPPRPEPPAQDDKAKQPALVLAASHTVTRQAADLLDEPVVVYRARTKHTITGIALHVAKRLLFVSDSGGVVWRASLDTEGTEEAILSPEQTRLRPHGLSVDWLNDLVYVVGQVGQADDAVGGTWQVARSSLDGRGLTVAVAGLPSRPLHVQVDPYNGFLFWVLGGPRGGGLYRLDLAEVSNGIKHETRPSVLLEDPHLGAFVVDHTNFRLLVPHHANNTVLAVSLDGREVADLRRNTQQAMFQNVVSLAVAGGLFYWTNGREVLTEEYHAGQDAYFHNTYPNPSDRSFVSVCVDGAAAQPVPVPVNPPTGVQAVLGAALAKASWQAPHLLGGQGRGAWQDWSYILSVRDEERGDTLEHRDVNATWCTVHGLREDTPYVVKAAAYTSAGIGPWSSEFRARTLRSHPPPASVLWSAPDGLLRSDVTGDHVETLVDAASLRDGRTASHFHADSLAWWRDRVYLVANTSLVYVYNLTSRELARLPHMDNVGSVAVDWVGQRLYWSNPKQQLITRGNLLGGQQEPLPILTVAKELIVDAANAFLYWSTGHGVESARLNGKGRRTYYPAELFSGKHVMGLTLARDSQSVFWVVRSYEGSALFRAPMADQLRLQPGEAVEPVLVSQLSASIRGPLCYFSHHLMWLQDDHRAVIGDLGGQNAAVISGASSTSLAYLYTVTVQDPEQQHIPGDLMVDADVIPKAVTQSSIRVTGSWESFNISWNRVSNVNYGQVFYELKIRDGTGKEMTQETLQHSVRCCGSLGQPPPYTELDVTVRALTYWGASPAVRARLHSPAARPREPHNPRVFVTYHLRPLGPTRGGVRGHHDAKNITALFRWDPPRQPNGPVQNYLVKHWYSRPVGDLRMCEPVVLAADKLEYEATLLEHNCTYYFQVQAFTEAGSGASSSPVAANTGAERPVPRLLLATTDALVMEDCDRRAETTLLRPAATPVDLDFLHSKSAEELGRVLWLSETQELRAATLDGRNKTKLAALTGPALSVAVDWVGRAVFWSELDEAGGSLASVVRKLYLDREGMTPVTVLRREGIVRQIAVAPLNSTLLWVEDGLLMTSLHDGSGVRRFFSRAVSSERRRRACTCPANPRVGPVLSVDHSDPGRPRVLWVDSRGGDVVAAELDACSCTVLVNARGLREAGLEAGLPPSAVTADGERVYWANASLGRVYSAPKTHGSQTQGFLASQGAQTSHGLTARELSGVRRITALGSHLQPYPAEHCLVPLQPAGVASLVSRNSSSVRLKLPVPLSPPHCRGVSAAPSASTLYYGLPGDCGKDQRRCRTAVFYDADVDVTGLEPFTEYVFMVSQSNFYSSVMKQPAELGPAVVFQTAEGAPTPPRDVRLRAEDPTTVRVWWRAPEHLNAEAVWYELHWRAEGPGPGARTSGQDVVPDQANKDLHTATLSKLAPGQSYAVWVRAHAQGSDAEDELTHSDSALATVRTLPEPGPLTLVEAKPYSLTVSWTPWLNAPANESLQSCALQYCVAGTGSATCRTLAVPVQHVQNVPLHLHGLQPKTNYSIRLEMTFPHSTQAFLWPRDARFTFQTLGDRPGPPGTPIIQHIHRSVYQVTWQPSEPNGSPVQVYNLEGWVRRKPVPQDTENTSAPQWAPRSRRQAGDDVQARPEPLWESFYNGSDNFWIMSELGADALVGVQYVFRARALNEYGWSNWSAESRSFDLSEAALLADQQELGVVLGIAIPVVLALCFLAALAALCVNRRREQEKKVLQASGPCAGGAVVGTGVGGVHGGLSGLHAALDVELATLRELPRRGNFIHRTNTLYTATGAPQDGPTDEEVALLPHIARHQITLTKFLGSGAFGEVFEGNARNLGDGTGEMRVAIKTLRKGASELEKSEFLKEAQLMSHFKHAHILQLLGVCLDNDPNFIIMELMEGGDLLSYLRCRRPQSHAGPGLTLQDLVGMCVDVARGCRYLEEMHFVHRDLACRNCLVSSLENNCRVVKIGDFGLARDIYKNDYYRKEGEGLLPVRWMAPESLMDGVFTCQSDVWAFGVLIWEVMTLGQQPYPARTNIEVLHYVRGGGRLGRPGNCPEDLHQLMLKCWLYSPEARPTFKYCLQILEDLKAKSLSLPIPPLNLVNGGVANRGYFEDENHNSSGDSWKTGSDGGSRDRVPFLSGSQTIPSIPKYLELIYDGEVEDRTRDGYEVPRPTTEYSNLPPSIPTAQESITLTPGTS